jgi:hypothetical protein
MLSPALQRFESADPLGLGGGGQLLYDNNPFGDWLTAIRNSYGYCLINPISPIDPSGLLCEPAAPAPDPCQAICDDARRTLTGVQDAKKTRLASTICGPNGKSVCECRFDTDQLKHDECEGEGNIGGCLLAHEAGHVKHAKCDPNNKQVHFASENKPGARAQFHRTQRPKDLDCLWKVRWKNAGITDECREKANAIRTRLATTPID